MTHKLKYFLIAIAGLFLISSCKKQLDVNTDPNRPVDVPLSTLLVTAQVGLGNSLAIGTGLSQDLAVYTHQMSTREDANEYGVTGTEFFLTQSWPRLYRTTIANLDQIIKDATENEDMVYAGIAKILKAYTYSQMVDVFGDIPFSEASKLLEGIRYPKFDDDTEIYPQLFEMLDAGVADLENTGATNTNVPASDDIIYKGDVDKWIKAANTIKLKLYTQVHKVQDVTTAVNALIAEDNMISSTEEGFMLPYGPNGATDDRNPGFGDYYATQRSNHVSPWLYEIMKGYNSRINTGITDPRIPYYIYNQETATSAPDNNTEYRDGAFVSIYFGSKGENAAKSQQNTVSLFGIYPVGGKYDEGTGGVASASSSTGAAPYRFITYADRLYLEAELIHEGVVDGDEKATLKAAMLESFRQIDYVVSGFVKPTTSVPSIFNEDDNSDMTKYIDEILADYDAANAAKKFEIIMTQKWLSSIGSSIDQYTDYRRTGYPIMFDPNDPIQAPGGLVQPPINGDPMNPGAQAAVPVQLSIPYPKSLPWSQTEIETNPNAPAQKKPSEYKVFWMP
ncbi:MAG: SusD/RagB family nutrient-binding outer membrane lipoprotein [Chitinophagaceae bacterium]|nr:SusD/RagB family nutrient-binding outer membrane lipoprotein [Chitinophagaceae bacterium]